MYAFEVADGVLDAEAKAVEDWEAGNIRLNEDESERLGLWAE